MRVIEVSILIEQAGSMGCSLNKIEHPNHPDRELNASMKSLFNESFKESLGFDRMDQQFTLIQQAVEEPFQEPASWCFVDSRTP